jgi:CCR4-NOT transcription complex subunit 9
MSQQFGTGWPSGRASFQYQSYGAQNHARDSVPKLVKGLISPSERSEALHTLSVQREQIPDLALMLWESPATMTALLSEILGIYPYLAAAPGSLSSRMSTRVLNVLALFQCVAGHEETRMAFIHANIPVYLFPFLHTTNQSRECECFKLTALGIIGSLVKSEQPEIIEYLLQNEFVPLCLRILKFGQEMSKIVAAFVVQKILSDANGRKSICQNPERRETVLKVLNLLLHDLAKTFSPRLAKNVVLSYRLMLDSKEVVALIRQMDLPVLQQPLVGNYDEQFRAFIERLREIKGKKEAPVITFARPDDAAFAKL